MEGGGWRGGQVARCGIVKAFVYAVNDRKDLCMICMIRLCTGSHNTVSDQSRPDIGVDSQSCDTSSQTLRQKN